MTHGYNENYLSHAGKTLGMLFDTALSVMSPEEFTSLFVGSDVARSWEAGNPTYLAGKSPGEIYEMLTGIVPEENVQQLYPAAGYWSGYVCCVAQWYFGCSFGSLFSVLPLEEILILYNPLHEADISRTIDVFHRRLFPEPALKTLRERRNLSQSQLAMISNVNLRSIKAYEQGDLDIGKAQYNTLASLATALCCSVPDLIS